MFKLVKYNTRLIIYLFWIEGIECTLWWWNVSCISSCLVFSFSIAKSLSLSLKSFLIICKLLYSRYQNVLVKKAQWCVRFLYQSLLLIFFFKCSSLFSLLSITEGFRHGYTAFILNVVLNVPLNCRFCRILSMYSLHCHGTREYISHLE